MPTCTADRSGLMIWDLHVSHRADEVKTKHNDVISIPGGVTGATHYGHARQSTLQVSALCEKELDSTERP